MFNFDLNATQSSCKLIIYEIRCKKSYMTEQIHNKPRQTICQYITLTLCVRHDWKALNVKFIIMKA